MKIKKYRIYLIIVATTLILFSGFRKDYFEVSKQLDIFATLFKELNIYYVDDTDPDELINEAINSMLETLDPYTTFMTEDEAEDFQVHTSGEYAGIGASIRKINEEVVIIQIYEGYSADKAGLKAGDVILQIDNIKMTSKNTAEVSHVLKGSVSSDISVLIKRPGVKNTITIKLKREKIRVKSVPYYGFINNDVGYITLNSFSKKASSDISSAFDELKHSGMKYLILDLRNNPGGLLSQAVNVSNIFLPKKTFIVETKGRIKDWNRKYYTNRKAKDTDIPIVVLTNYGTASASEIVAGAFQDLDRAVIMGNRTFGKGLVQQPRSLSYGTQLKITIAKYYIPSGRSIQARDYFHRNKDGSAKTIPDSLRHIFNTKGGRIVFDGAGIEPDIKFTDNDISDFTTSMIKNNLIFNYSVLFSNSNSSKVDINKFIISDEELIDFKKYIDSEGFVFESKLENKLNELKILADEENLLSELENSISKLELRIKEENTNAFNRNKKQIKKLLELSIINNEYYERGRYLYSIKNDELILKASNLLQDQNKYKELLVSK